MERIIRFFVVIVFSVTAGSIFSQPINDMVSDVTVASPNVAAMNKYTDIPVSNFTGIPSVGVPIYTIQEGPISVPISLSYHGGGTKLGDLSSWVGLGWNLNAGGMVSRSVVGFADDYFGDNTGFITGLFRNYDLENEDDVEQILIDGLDTEPDVFNFNFGGYSGKMIYSHGNDDGHECQGGWNIYPRSDLKVKEFYGGGNCRNITRFEFTTPQGLKYSFGTPSGQAEPEVEYSVFSKSGAYPNVDQITTGWYLKSITSPNGLYTVTFNYTREQYKFPFLSSNEYSITHYEASSDCSAGSVVHTAVEPLYSFNVGRRLTSITTSTGKVVVNFIAEEFREDLDMIVGGDNPNSFEARRLERIEIETGDNNISFCKAFRFAYHYLNPNADFSFEKRLILDQVQENTCGANGFDPNGEIPPYSFYYAPGTSLLPNRLSKQIDHWGYYNGAESNEDKFTLIPYTAYAPHPIDPDILLYYLDGDPDEGAERKSSGAHMVLGSLKRVEYPTGGHTEFNFSANTEYGPIWPREQAVNNRYSDCILNPDSYNHIDAPHSFNEEELLTAKYRIQVNVSNFGMGNSDCPPCISTNRFSARITARQDDDPGIPVSVLPDANINVAGSDLYCNGQVEFTDGYQSISDFSPPLTAGINYTYTIEIIQGEQPFNADGGGTVFFDIMYNRFENVEVGGLRVNSVTSHPLLGPPVVTNYDYSTIQQPGGVDEDSRSSGQVLIQPKYGYLVYDGPLYMRRYSSSPLVNTAEFNGYFFGYKNVTVRKGTQKSTYKHYLTPQDNSTTFPIVPLPPIYTTGQNYEQKQFAEGGTNPVASQILTGETSFEQNVGSSGAIKIFTITCGSDQGMSGAGGPYDGPSASDPPFNRFIIQQNYSIPTPAYYRVVTTEETLDNVEKIITTLYDPADGHTMSTGSSVTNSDGIVHKTTYQYPQMLSNADNPANQSMIDKNMIGIPIIIEKSVNNLVVSGQKNLFYDFAGGPNGTMTLPHQSIATYLNAPDRIMTTLDYNGDGKIATVDRLGAPRETYTWANDLPQSKTIEVANALGEDWTWNYSFYSGTKFLESITDLNDQVTSFTYDNFFRLREKSERGDLVNTSYDYIYMNPGQVGSTNKVIQSTTFSDADTQSSEQETDGLGRPVANVINGITKEEMVYNHMGQIVKQTYLPGVFKDILYEPNSLSRPIGEIYPDGSLVSIDYGNEGGGFYKKIITDENGNATITLTDKIGQHIETRDALDGSTKYFYDDIGNLSIVKPPEGSSYEYFYDEYNRLIRKIIPGGGIQEFMYSDRDLLRASKDENLTGLNRWLVTDYDVVGRPVRTGFYDSSQQPPNPNSVLPLVLLSETFYDNYTNLTNNNIAHDCSGGSTLGAMVGSRVYQLDGVNPILENPIETSNCLDDYGRAVRTYSTNHLTDINGLPGIDKYTPVYDMADNTLSLTRSHYSSFNTIADLEDLPLQVIESYTYDNFFRPLENWHKVILPSENDGVDVLISDLLYNDLDQLKLKRIHGPASSSKPLQSIDYTYNIRGWLTHINEVSTGGDDELIPDCDTDEPTECGPVCDWSVTINSNIEGNDFSIIGIYVKGGQLMDLNYPIHPPYTNLKNEIETWLWDNNVTFGAVSVTSQGTEYTINVTQPAIPFNKIRQSNPRLFSIETYFRGSNCEETGPPVTVCELCRRHGYSCDKCPYWELEEPCGTCQSLGITDCNSCDFEEDICTRCTNMGYPDCNSCPLSVGKIKPLKIQVEYNHALLNLSGQSSLLIRVSGQSIAYLHDGTARVRENENITIVGTGNFVSSGPATYPNLLEIDLSDQMIVASTLDSVMAAAEIALINELTNAGIMDTTIQTNFVDMVLAEATIDWPNTTDPEVPSNNSSSNPDLFAMELIYEGSHDMVTSNPQYNGNISGMVWKTGFGSVNSYSFEYDAINRLQSGLFRDDLGGGNYAVDNKYGVSMTYDAIGNIQKLQRRGVDDYCTQAPLDPIYEFSQIDNLTYLYQDNRLQSITEGSNQSRGFKGSGGSYAYDGNGNMVADQNKAMTAEYNHLNLPYIIRIETDNNNNSINFTYDAAGTKLKKHAVGFEDGEDVNNITDYVGGIEYKNGEIEAIYHAEGRVRFETDDGIRYNLTHEYYLKDHLGNVRVVFSDLNENGYLEPFAFDPAWPILSDPMSYEPSELLQENHYYPFGMEMEGPWELSVSSPENKYNYNGKELESDFGLDWLDYGARMYDPSIGRWNAVDPLAEAISSWAPYAYTFDNPINYSDPTGMMGESSNVIETNVRNSKTGETIDIDDGHDFDFDVSDEEFNAIKESGSIYGAGIQTWNRWAGEAASNAVSNADWEWAWNDYYAPLIKMITEGIILKKLLKKRVVKGHTRPWAQMTAAEQRAFQHSYSRHAEELGLPNWQQSNAESLRKMFNNKVTSIREAGANDFFESTQWVNGVQTTVNKTTPIINGQRYYYYETLEGKFVSAGKFTD